MTTLSAIHLSDNRLSVRLSQLKMQLGAALARRRVYRTTVNELRALSNRELADLGLHRSMIKRIALDAANEV